MSSHRKQDLRDELTFFERLGSDADVRLEPGINQDEVFDDQFERRAHEIQRTPGADNAVSIIPSKQGPWSGNNQLGIQREFAPDAENRQTILRLDEWGFPEDWTLSLGLDYDRDAYTATDAFFECTALIEFGSGGVTQYVEIDWQTGTSITLPMNALNVVAQYSSAIDESGFPVALPQDLKLRASICRGSCQNAAPSRSTLVDVVDAFVPIPPFAKSLYLLKTGAVSAFNFFSDLTLANSVRFLGAQVGSAATAVLQRAQFLTYLSIAEGVVGSPVAVPIPLGAKFVSIPGVNGELTFKFMIGL